MVSALEIISSEPASGRIEERFAQLRANGGRALITYLTAGYPRPEDTTGLLETLSDSGADIIELGIPFSDPLADGPTIQRKSQQAIAAGATLRTSLDALAAFRERSETPVVVFSYLNPVMAYGVDAFLRDCIEVGADGVLLTDLPVGGDAELEERFERSPLSLIRLIAPTTSAERAATIAARAQGFIYFVSRTGVTGTRNEVRAEIAAEVEALREHASVPIAVGFGISSPEQAEMVGRVADGVIVGSALIHALDEGGPGRMGAFVRSLRTALDRID